MIRICQCGCGRPLNVERKWSDGTSTWITEDTLALYRRMWGEPIGEVIIHPIPERL